MNGQTVIITGASRGLGAAAARIIAQQGASVVLAARSIDMLNAEVEKIGAAGGRAWAVRADVSLQEDCRAIIQQALDHFGRIDALVNNGGIIEPIGPIAEARSEEWAKNWAVNLLGPVMLTQMALPSLRQGNGRIVNITSAATQTPIGGWGAYSAAKAAINHLTRILAGEEPAVTSLALFPGIVDTDMQATVREKGKSHMAERNYQWLLKLHQQGKLLPPEVPGRAIACLALHAPHDWSGEALAWDEERVQQLVSTCSTS